MKIKIHTDGSCLGNPGPGGWGAVIHYNDQEHQLSGNEKDSTNNRMEMKAMIEALRFLKKKIAEKDLTEATIELYSDSNLLIQTLNKGWKRKANLDFWAELDAARAWLNISWIWVKAHANNKYNNVADELAQKAAGEV
jgi:ribonuclease HI